ncbi:MAG: hypothetical protein HY238_26630 [Acidobacteria bacterium]|nr:hypothetical protein [Acidobacteriota bacterium]
MSLPWRILWLLLAPLAAWAQFTVLPVATGPSDQDYPAIASGRDGRTWAAWVDYDGEGDTIPLVPLAAGYLGSRVQMNEGHGDVHRPALAVDGRGYVLCVWSEQKAGNWDLYGRWFGGGQLSPIERLTTDPFPDTQPVMTADSTGKIWLAWQGAVGRKTSQVLLRSWANGKWGPVVQVVGGESNAWEPALAADSKGGILVAWDSYQNGKYDVYFARHENNRLTPARALTGDLRFHARPSLAVDAQNRVWVAWEEGSPDWGKDSAQMKKGLHAERRVRVTVIDGESLLAPAADPLQGLPPMTEFAHLAIDGGGRVWLFVRTNTNQQIWRLVARSYAGSRWSAPIAIEPSAGRQAVRTVSARDENGAVQILWATDRRKAPFQAVDNDIHYGRTPSGPAAGAPQLTQAAWPALEQAAGSGRRTWPDYTLSLASRGSQSYRLVWGELHRHTDINHHGRPDGALEDAYRYARDAALLDFFATTEHIDGEPLTMGLNPMTWWRIQKYCDLMRVPGVFEPIYAYERSMPSPGGHKNILFAGRGGALVGRIEGRPSAADLPPYLWRRLRESKAPALTIPHQLTGPAIDWQYHDRDYQTVMEIYQGRRQNYEYDGAPQPPGVEQVWGKQAGSWAWDALARGYKMGFIASSDHFSTHMSYAAVYTADPSAQGIFDAIKARRTYAASDNIVLDYRAIEASGAEHAMGEAFATAKTPRWRVRAIGTGVVEKAEIVRNGRFLYSLSPDAREFQFEFQDADPPEGEAYYYVRLRQCNGHLAWSSPIWVTVRR